MHERETGNKDSWSPKRVRLLFYGLLWLVTVSLLPLACAQTTTVAPPPSPTVGATPSAAAPTRNPTTPRPTTTPPVAAPQPVATTQPMETPQPMMTPAPTVTVVSPTVMPTAAQRPTGSPTVSPVPTLSPTNQPTVTPWPTGMPSVSPTDVPSALPSYTPTAEPTFAKEISVRTVFNQRFQIGNEREFNETEIVWFCQNMASYTDDFGGRNDYRVNTTCRIISQALQIIGGNRRLRDGLNNEERKLQGVVFNQVEYGMSYRSNHTNVTTYPTLFQNYVNEDLDRLTTDLQNAGLAITNSFLAFNNIATAAPTTIPTLTPFPTVTPTLPVPTTAPSPSFTRNPAMPIEVETATPSVLPGETPEPQGDGGVGQGTVITVSVIAALSAVMVALFVFYRNRKRTNERKFQEQAAAAGAASGATGWNASRDDMHIDTGEPYDDALKNGKSEMTGILSPAESQQSRDSLLSTGGSPLSDGSDREEDGTHNLADEFDQYKDQNLEKMRSGVEGNLSGFDGMMSQALTKALMGDDDQEVIDMSELRWGGTGDSTEIEATALYEVTDWLKRKEGATAEEK